MEMRCEGLYVTDTACAPFAHDRDASLDRGQRTTNTSRRIRITPPRDVHFSFLAFYPQRLYWTLTWR